MFREGFQGDFSGVTGAFRRGCITYFHGKIFGKRRGRRGWKWGRGGGRGEEGEEK